jgi:DNA-binding transcriptional ArsR family regulator
VSPAAPYHPPARDLDLVEVLDALGDPVRLEIVSALGRDRERSCGDFHATAGVSLSTLSHHLRVLREAGITNTRLDGKHRFISLRADDLERRFPGVIAAILGAAQQAEP